MKEKTFGILAGILNLLLLVVCVLAFFAKDSTAPKLTEEDYEFVYYSTISQKELLKKVSAWDERDGDLTDAIVVEKIVTDEKTGSAAITYGVADHCGNVAKITCHVEAKAEEKPEKEVSIAGEETQSQVPVAEEEKTEDEEALEEEAEEESDEEEIRDAEALPTAGEAGNTVQTVEARPDTGRPTMILRTSEVRVKAGVMPAWTQVLEGLRDDKDDYSTLLQTLKVHGEYDINKAGSYDVTLTVTDGEGKESNAYPLKMIVEE